MLSLNLSRRETIMTIIIVFLIGSLLFLSLHLSKRESFVHNIIHENMIIRKLNNSLYDKMKIEGSMKHQNNTNEVSPDLESKSKSVGFEKPELDVSYSCPWCQKQL